MSVKSYNRLRECKGQLPTLIDYYIPGEELYIYINVANTATIFYTVPSGYVLFVDYISSTYVSGTGQSFLEIEDSLGFTLLYDLGIQFPAAGIFVGPHASWNPMHMFPAGTVFTGTASGTAMTVSFHVHGYLVQLFNGV